MLADHDVAGLHITVQNAVVVSVLNRAGDGFEIIRGAPGRQRAVAAHNLGEAAALDQSHREKEEAVGMADVVDGNDVVVLELRVRPRFVLETDCCLVVGVGGRVAPPVGLDQLESDDSIGAALERPVDNAHAARSDPVQDQILADDPAERPINLGEVVHSLGPQTDPAACGRDGIPARYQQLGSLT